MLKSRLSLIVLAGTVGLFPAMLSVVWWIAGDFPVERLGGLYFPFSGI